jgi:hypothetical protein
MSAKSDEFEQIIANVYRMLLADNDSVTWNDTIPDPDNISQSRQIDITINNKGFITHVECRIHRSKQDVKWIEELYGRKISLRANHIIGVSSSGFTSGAIKKAEHFGIELRDTIYLDTEDIKSWGKVNSGSLEYFAYEKVDVALIFPSQEIADSITEEELRYSLKNYPSFHHDILSSIANIGKQLWIEKELGDKAIDIQGSLNVPALRIKDQDITLVKFIAKGLKLMNEDFEISKSLMFGRPLTNEHDRNAHVQKFSDKGAGIIKEGHFINAHSGLGVHFRSDIWQLTRNTIFLSFNVKWTGGGVIQIAIDTLRKDQESKPSAMLAVYMSS